MQNSVSFCSLLNKLWTYVSQLFRDHNIFIVLTYPFIQSFRKRCRISQSELWFTQFVATSNVNFLSSPHFILFDEKKKYIESFQYSRSAPLAIYTNTYFQTFYVLPLYFDYVWMNKFFFFSLYLLIVYTFEMNLEWLIMIGVSFFNEKNWWIFLGLFYHVRKWNGLEDFLVQIISMKWGLIFYFWTHNFVQY